MQIDDRRIQDHLGELVRGTVEETLNTMLDAEADTLCGAQRYERSPDRVDTRSYERKLHTKAGEVLINNLCMSLKGDFFIACITLSLS